MGLGYTTFRALCQLSRSRGILPTALTPEPQCRQEAAVGLGLCQAAGPGVFSSTGSGPRPGEQMLTHISTVQGEK